MQLLGTGIRLMEQYRLVSGTKCCDQARVGSNLGRVTIAKRGLERGFINAPVNSCTCTKEWRFGFIEISEHRTMIFTREILFTFDYFRTLWIAKSGSGTKQIPLDYSTVFYGSTSIDCKWKQILQLSCRLGSQLFWHFAQVPNEVCARPIKILWPNKKYLHQWSRRRHSYFQL